MSRAPASKPPRRAAIYSRVSTRKEEQERALDSALERLRRAAADRGLEVVLEESDQLTGKAEKTLARAGYQRLRAAVEAREVDIVLGTRLARFARSVRELIDFADLCKTKDVDLVLLDEPIDTTSSMGRFCFVLYAALAELEREQIVERVRSGMDGARARGVRFGRPRKDPALAVEARRLHAEGLSLRAIADRIQRSTARTEGKAIRVSKDWVAGVLRASA